LIIVMLPPGIVCDIPEELTGGLTAGALKG
jgi:hypothetical protein